MTTLVLGVSDNISASNSNHFSASDSDNFSARDSESSASDSSIMRI